MIPLIIEPVAAQAEPMTKTLSKMALSPEAQQETYAVARVLMDAVNFILRLVGLENNLTLFTLIYAALVFVIAIGVGYVVKWIVVQVVYRIGRHTQNALYHSLLDRHFYTKITRIIPAVVFLIFIQFTLNEKVTLASWLTRLTWIYIVFIFSWGLCVVADAIWDKVNRRANKKNLPLNGLIQLVKGIVWIVCGIVVLAILLNKSPGALLAGLGAFAAVLMLVFKDSILGVVAGVQLSENDSLHVGDWIKVHGTDANGTVIDVSLTTIKIQNWDKTVTEVPPYSLVTGSFTNYRPMQESGTRRIQRSYMIDADSVVPADEALLDEFAKLPLLKDWIAKKKEQREAGQVCNASNPAGLVDGSIETNLGVFRAYVKLYLDAHAQVSHTSDCFVTTLAQTAYGIPLQVYCFTNTSKWFPYEAIQASIFEHIAVMLFRFHLYTYESASGRDTLLEGWMSPGKNPDVMFGLPYPFFNASGSPETPAYPVQESACPLPGAMTPAASVASAPADRPRGQQPRGDAEPQGA